MKNFEQLYIIVLVETTKASPRHCFYVSEITGILQTTDSLENAFFTSSYDGACLVADFVNEKYDYRATVTPINIGTK